MSGEQEVPPLRADARRNREQIIEAARTLFARLGPAVPMEEVARTAGVGVATLYRRFPDRDHLIEAVSHANTILLVERAREVERDAADPAAALATLLRTVLDLRLGVLLATVSPRTLAAVQNSSAIAGRRDEVLAILRRLLERAQADGLVRGDIGIGDALLALMLVPLTVVPQTDDDFGNDVLDRLLALVLDGLRSRDGRPLPGRPLDYGDIEDLTRRGVLSGRGKPGASSTRPEAARSEGSGS